MEGLLEFCAEYQMLSIFPVLYLRNMFMQYIQKSNTLIYLSQNIFPVSSTYLNTENERISDMLACSAVQSQLIWLKLKLSQKDY